MELKPGNLSCGLLILALLVILCTPTGCVVQALQARTGSFVRAKRVGSPNRTPCIDLRPRYYAVLQAPGLVRATIFKSSAGYWGCIGSLEGSSAISQSFPSEIEARIYLESAGAEEIETAP